jgi:hypothetical protein
MESMFASFFNRESSITDSQTVRNLEYRISLKESIIRAVNGWVPHFSLVLGEVRF